MRTELRDRGGSGGTEADPVERFGAHLRSAGCKRAAAFPLTWVGPRGGTQISAKACTPGEGRTDPGIFSLTSSIMVG
jgi:hypothetical protein